MRNPLYVAWAAMVAVLPRVLGKHWGGEAELSLADKREIRLLWGMKT
jgi:hypothetical protein